MSNTSNTKIELTEIADYRGNLSFAEENNPIPFSIKSVFWSTISEDISWTTSSQVFLIVLDGQVQVNAELLDRPNQAFLAESASKLELKLISDKATILLVMDKAITQDDTSEQMDKAILKMPKADNFHGLKGYFANSGSTLPFDIKRVYFTYDIPETERRGGHAHKELTSIVFAVQGSFDVILDDAKNKQQTHLNTQNDGLHIKPGLWREIENFSNHSVVLVLASEVYSIEDYTRSYRVFKQENR